jgi:hypothetical protein
MSTKRNKNSLRKTKGRTIARPRESVAVAKRVNGIYELTNAEVVPFANAAYNTIPSYAIKRETLESNGTLIPTNMGRPILRLKKNKVVYPLIEGSPYALPYSYVPSFGYVRLNEQYTIGLNRIPNQDYDNPGVRVYGPEFNDIKLYDMKRRNKNQMFSPKGIKI